MGSWLRRRRSRVWVRVSTAEKTAEGEEVGFVRKDRARARVLRSLVVLWEIRVWRFFRRSCSIGRI